MNYILTILLASSLTLLLSCNRNIVNKPLQIPYSPGTDSTGIANPNKSISSFVIMAADNPGVITTDIKGNVILDTVKLVFQPGTNLSSLIPTVGIVGKSVSPASKIAENFDSTLVYTVTATDGSAFAYRVVSYYQ
ncbi:MAG TPA: hypothetical protein VFE32_04200 [Puia sp.]|jgi:hypothetical protein|nr:hypothetical protein [Puia sp.]